MAVKKETTVLNSGDLVRVWQHQRDLERILLLSENRGHQIEAELDRCSQAVDAIDLEKRRALGIFFTPERLGKVVARDIGVVNLGRENVLDPACGAGDLLIELARHLPVQDTFPGTLASWGRVLHGLDVVPEFARLARLRLAVLAKLRGNFGALPPECKVAKYFPGIRAGDGLRALAPFASASSVVLNPPFGLVPSGSRSSLRGGSISLAALFVAKVLDASPPGTRVSAVLPEVLRTGTTYSQWRAHVEERFVRQRTLSLGRFSSKADVDVYLLSGQVRVPRQRRRAGASLQYDTVGHRFTVHVGPVVPHRHRDEEDQIPYLHARNAPPGEEITSCNDERGFSGRVFPGPFVAIRRTSRPGDRERAVGTLYAGKRSVAVENHLLVAVPKDGEIETCRELLRVLASEDTTNWLNTHMRCRHLTTRILAVLPWGLEPSGR